MPKVKYIPDKHMLQLLNKAAIENGYNKVIEPAAFDRIPDARYPITQSILHNDDSVRCQVVLNAINNESITVLLDVSIGVFNLLPEYDTETKEG